MFWNKNTKLFSESNKIKLLCFRHNDWFETDQWSIVVTLFSLSERVIYSDRAPSCSNQTGAMTYRQTAIFAEDNFDHFTLRALFANEEKLVASSQSWWGTLSPDRMDVFSVVLYMETNVRLQIFIFCVCVHGCGCAFKYFMVFSIFMKQQEQCVLPALNFSSRNSC